MLRSQLLYQSILRKIAYFRFLMLSVDTSKVFQIKDRKVNVEIGLLLKESALGALKSSGTLSDVCRNRTNFFGFETTCN